MVKYLALAFRHKVTLWTKTSIGLAGLFCLLIGCSPALLPVPAEGPPLLPHQALKVSGAGGVTILLEAVRPAFEAANPSYTLEVLPGSGTGGGVEGILEGVLDIAAMARPPKEDEIAKKIAYVEFGKAGQAIITHPGVGVDDLMTAQLQAIFAGQVDNWSQVGGADLALILYMRDENDSSTKALRSFIQREEPFPPTVAKVFTSQGDMLTAVAGTPGSVGIANWPAARALKANVRGVKVNGVGPGDPAYPILSSFGLGYLTSHQDQVQPLLDWLLSEPGRTVLREFEVIVDQG